MAEELTKLPEVAKTIFMDCKKCGEERYFKVLAHKDEKTAKTECEVCGAKKTFKLKSPKKKKTARKTRRKKTVDPAEKWSELLEKVGTENKLPYNMKAKFPNDVTIDHPKFGLGVITISTPTKIEVVFEDGERSLVHNRT